MNKETSQLLLKLKENNEDYEWYPTTKEILYKIFDSMPMKFHGSVLDIGCGTCNFNSYFEEYHKELHRIGTEREEYLYREAERRGDRYWKKDVETRSISRYYVIEKSKTLIAGLDKDVIVLGTDFHQTLLIDKPVDVIFCNPPYSEYVQWTKKIIDEGNCPTIYLVIPERWKDNEEISRIIEVTNSKVDILGSFDFLNADRSARAKVDVLEITKNCNTRYMEEEINNDAFDRFFDEVFKMRQKEENRCSDYEKSQQEKKSIRDQLVNTDSKAKILVDLYNAELNTLFEHFKAICAMDVDVLETIGVNRSGVKEAIKQKTKSLKILYWDMVFDEMDEITSKLTHTTRENMKNGFKGLLTVDFTLDNIYALLLWVIKNANGYYDEQLIDFYKSVSHPDNVKMYKSNQKVFKRNEWRCNRWDNPKDVSHYTLDYRIIMSSLFRTSYSGKLDVDYSGTRTLEDIMTIARNLGFEPTCINAPSDFGESCKIMFRNEEGFLEILMDYRVYKNGNMHVKFNQEFIKALNVEASRLLGWIHCKEDIAKEFPAEMAKGAEKYFKANPYISLEGNGLKLLGKIGE